MDADKHKNTAEFLEQTATQGKLFALIDPFFDISLACPRRRLQIRDTDPFFYDMIAWEQVTYQPPQVLQLDLTSLRLVLHTLATERWGLLFVSDHNIDTVAAHFQKFVITKGPDGNPYFLRFHDASVLSVLLETWTQHERDIFSGPVKAFGLPEIDSSEIRIRSRDIPQQQRINLAPQSIVTGLMASLALLAKAPVKLPTPEDCLLQLRSEQLALCAQAIEQDLVKVICWHLRNFHSKAVQYIEREKLESRVRVAIAKGRLYRLSSLADLAGFAALMFELAPNFDEHPSFQAVLTDERFEQSSKMKRLSQVITDREWGEALKNYDREFWRAAQVNGSKRKAG
jgi:hypothetical protein